MEISCNKQEGMPPGEQGAGMEVGVRTSGCSRKDKEAEEDGRVNKRGGRTAPHCPPLPLKPGGCVHGAVAH